MPILQQLEDYIRARGRVVVAFSGGVDSALLAYVARKTLGSKNMLAITGDSLSLPSRDRDYCADFCRKYDIPHQFMPTFEFNDPNYVSNPANRCFFCKEELYKRLKEFCATLGYAHILDGTNVTDLKGHRPGFAALKQEEITAPYVALEINKVQIREMARFLKLEAAEKPQSACISSRVPTGTPINMEAIQKIDAAENFLKDLGMRQPRVRYHHDLARLELKKEEWAFCLEQRKKIQEGLKRLGFNHVTLDLKDYDREG